MACASARPRPLLQRFLGAAFLESLRAIAQMSVKTGRKRTVRYEVVEMMNSLGRCHIEVLERSTASSMIAGRSYGSGLRRFSAPRGNLA